MHARQRLAAELRMLLIGYLMRQHPRQWRRLWESGLVAHATPWCKPVRVPGEDVWIQAVTPTVEQEEGVSMGGPAPGVDDLALWAAHPSDAISHIMVLLNWKAFPSARSDLFLLVMWDEHHPDCKYGKKALNDLRGFMCYTAPGVRMAIRDEQGRDHFPPGTIVALVNARLGTLAGDRVNVLVDTIGQSSPPNNAPLVADCINPAVAGLLSQWSEDCLRVPFIDLAAFAHHYGPRNVWDLHARGFRLTSDAVQGAFAARAARASSQWMGFPGSSITRNRTELSGLLREHDAAAYMQPVRAEGVGPPSSSGILGMSASEMASAAQTVELILERIAASCLLMTAETITQELTRAGVAVQDDWADPISEAVQLRRGGIAITMEPLTDYDHGAITCVVRAIWLALAGADDPDEVDATVLGDSVGALYADTDVSDMGIGSPLGPPSREDIASVCRYACVLSGAPVSGARMSRRGFSALFKCSPIVVGLAQRPDQLRLRGITIFDIEAGVVAVAREA